MDLEGTVVNGVVVPDEPERLSEGARVRIVGGEVTAAGSAPVLRRPSALAERLLKLAGTAPGLPADMARNHDHYIHGAPKR